MACCDIFKLVDIMVIVCAVQGQIYQEPPAAVAVNEPIVSHCPE